MTQRLVNKWTGRQPRPCRDKFQPFWQVLPSPLSILTVVTPSQRTADSILKHLSLSRIFLSLILKSISLQPHLMAVQLLVNLLQLFSTPGSAGPFTGLHIDRLSSLTTLLVTLQWDAELCHCSLKMNSLPFRQHLWCTLALSEYKRTVTFLNLDTIFPPVAAIAAAALSLSAFSLAHLQQMIDKVAL